jgi:hypothetical protein
MAHFVSAWSLLGDERRRGAGRRAFEEYPHAQRLSALRQHQAHLAANMVGIFERGHLRFVLGRIFLETRNPLFDRLAKSGADLVVFEWDAVDHDLELLWAMTAAVREYFFGRLKFSRSVPIVAKSKIAR